MSADEWVYDKYPEPFKTVLVYDLIEGQMFGYYDVRKDTFMDLNGSVIGYVAAWQNKAEDPKTKRTMSKRMLYTPKVETVKVQVRV